MTQRAAMIGSILKTEADLLIPGCHEKGLPDNIFFGAAVKKMTQKIWQDVQCDVPAAPAGDKASDAE